MISDLDFIILSSVILACVLPFYIYKEKIFKRGADISSIDIQNLVEKNHQFYINTDQKLSAFYLRLFDYKNFNYRKY